MPSTDSFAKYPTVRLALLFCLVACGPHPLAAKLRLSDYPTGYTLVLGTAPATLQARRAYTYHAPFSGPVEQGVTSPVGRADAGELLLFLDRERMQIEGRLLEIERQLTEKQEIPEQQLALFQSLRQVENREAEIGQQLAFIEAVESNPELLELFRGEDGPGKLDEEAALERLELERHVTQRILRSLEQPEIRKLAEELVTLKLRKREIEHEKRLREARIEMPFKGAYQLLLPVEPGQTTVEALQGDPLVRVEDLSAVYGVVEIHGSRWRSLPRQRLQLRIPGMSTFSKEFRADFHQARTPQQERGGELVYLFEFKGEGRSRAAAMRGGSLAGEILLQLDAEGVRLVPKLDLLEAYPEAFGDTWKAGVRRVFEDVQAVHVGQDKLAILQKNTTP